MGRGIIESALFRTERLGLELRTSDPASHNEGEAWIRTDLAPDTDQLATLRFDHGSGTWDIPVYEAGSSASSVSEAWRLTINGSTGYIPVITEDEAAFPELRFQHDGTTTALHNAPGLAAYFDITIDNTNSPITEGEDLTVDYTAENTGELQDTQDIELQDFDHSVVDTDADVTLDGSQSSSGTLVWSTQAGDAGDDHIHVRSDDNKVTIGVIIENEIPNSEDLHSRFSFDVYDGEATSGFSDLTGNGHDLTNGSITGVGATINGKQAGEFDGSSDTVYSESFADISAWTVIAVIDIEDASSSQNIVHFNDSTNTFLGVYDGDIAMYAGSVLAGDIATTSTYLITGVFNGSNSIIRENGTQTASGDVGGDSFGDISLGSRQPERSERYFDGQIGEVWTYPDARTSSEIDEAESYLADKWGITI